MGLCQLSILFFCTLRCKNMSQLIYRSRKLFHLFGESMAAKPLTLPCDLSEGPLTSPLALDENISSKVERGGVIPRETEDNNEEKSRDDTSGNEFRGHEVEGVAICQFFLLDRCHFGNRCHLSHSLPQSSSDVPDSTDRDQYCGHDTEQDGKNRKKFGKLRKMQKRGNSTKEVEGKELTKKPRMRTADDVISRILWDPFLDPTDFSVGYLDRFLGVLERPFSEFSWDTDVCSCDYSEELALPRHRIKYFTYKGRRVWDRESRMDGVFGSTGGPLEAPFAARGEKEEGNVTQETGLQESREEHHSTCNELQEETNGAHTGDAYNQRTSFHVHHGKDEEKETGELPPSLVEIATGDTQSTQKSLPSDTPQGKQETGNEKKVDDSELSTLTAQVSFSQRSDTNRKGDDGEQDEWKESWEGEEENKELSWHLYPSSPYFPKSPVKAEGPVSTVGAQSEPLAQRQQPGRRKPTHFITFRADTPAFLSGFQHLQEAVTALLPLSAPHWVSPKSLHVTLCLLTLCGPEEVSAACEALRDFARKHGQRPLGLSVPPELGHFGGRVLFLTPQPLSSIRSLNKPLQEGYSKRGWLHGDSVYPQYHLTLAKMEGKRGERVFQGVGDTFNGAEQLRAVHFGRLVVSKLYLCVINAATMGEDGFYETVCAVNLQ